MSKPRQEAKREIILNLWFVIQFAEKLFLKGWQQHYKTKPFIITPSLKIKLECPNFHSIHSPSSCAESLSHLIFLFCCLFSMMPFSARIVTLLRVLTQPRRQEDWTQSLPYLVLRLNTHKRGGCPGIQPQCPSLWLGLWILTGSCLIVCLWYLTYLSLDLW